MSATWRLPHQGCGLRGVLACWARSRESIGPSRSSSRSTKRLNAACPAEEITLDDGQWQAVKAGDRGGDRLEQDGLRRRFHRRHLVVDSPNGSLTYGDDFYACQPDYPYFVTTASLNNLSAVLAAVP